MKYFSVKRVFRYLLFVARTNPRETREHRKGLEIKLVNAKGLAYRFGGHTLAVQGAKNLEPLSGDDQTRHDKSRLDVNLRKHAREKFVESWFILISIRGDSRPLWRRRVWHHGAAARLSHFSKGPSESEALSRPMATASVKGHFGKACKIRGGVRELWL